MDSRTAVGTVKARAFGVALVLIFARVSPIVAAIPASDVPLVAPVLTPALPLAVSEGAPGKPDYEAATQPDRIGRIIVPVMVNRQGPFLFALDTGANRTVLTPRLIALLGLQSTDDDNVIMQGATGSAVVPTALIERVAVGDVALVQQQLPVVRELAGIDGILGVDALGAKRVMVDFKTGRIDIRNARFEEPIAGAARIAAQLRFGRLMVVDAYVDRVRVKAVIDTGSQSTLGNAALHTALFVHAHSSAPGALIDVLGETQAMQQGERKTVADITVGDVHAEHFNIVFGDFYVFSLWDLDRRPALVIGMDLIGKLDALVVDYQRSEVQFRVRTARD